MITRIEVSTPGQGLHEISSSVQKVLTRSGFSSGLCTLFIQHTSASLCIQENADPSAKADLENWINRLAPENDPSFTHTAEGPDDMPSHIKAALTPCSLGIPFEDNTLCLGTWQGIYLWEHRRVPHRRKLSIHLLEDSLK